MRKTRLALLPALALAALVVPAAANAASTTSQVSGLVGTELSVAAATPAQMSLSHAAAATTSSVVSVTSTNASWTLSIKDAGTDATLGRMDKCNLLGVLDNPLVSLTNPLQWAPDGTTFANLTGSGATVGSGSLVGTKTVTFRQALAGTDAVAAGDLYCLTVGYDVL